MKALSLRQPWAHMVVHGPKRIENRRWNTSFRGEFLIHAAKGCTENEYDDALFFAMQVDPEYAKAGMPGWKETARGGIIGIARLLTVIPPVHVQQSMNVDCYPCDLEFGWHMTDQWGFVLGDVRPLPFLALRGELGFFEAS